MIHENKTLQAHLKKVGTDCCCISVLSVQELYYGIYNALSQYQVQEELRVDKILHRFPIVPIPEDGHAFGRIKARLRQSGRMIDDFDILIAATAIKHGLTVVTDNLKHFSRIDGLTIENWIERDN